MRHSYYILVFILGFAACNTPQTSNSENEPNGTSPFNGEGKELHQAIDTLEHLFIAIDTINVYSKIKDFRIPDSIASDSPEIDKFKPFLFNRDNPNARFMKRLKIDDRSELIVIHENTFHDNFIYGFFINLPDQSISDNLVLAGRLNFEGSRKIESSKLQIDKGKLKINQILKECYDCTDVGSNYPVLICDSCTTKSTLVYFDSFYGRIMTKPNKK